MTNYKNCFLPVISEAIRLTLTDSTPLKILRVNLSPVDGQGSRARAGAKFHAVVALLWGPSVWADGVLIVDARGYPVAWSLEAVGKWLAKALSGEPCVVDLHITDAANIPPKWTQQRANSAALKVSAVSAVKVVADAAKKVASVQGWALSQRRTEVMDAAARMVDAAELLLVVQGVQGGAPLGDPVPVPDPDPNPDPDPVPEPTPETDYPGELVGFIDAPTLEYGVPVSSQIEVAGDIDYYRLDLGLFDWSLRVRRFGPEPQMTGPLTVHFYNAEKSQLEQWTEYLFEDHHLNIVEAGIYYVSIDGASGYGDSPGQYSVELVLN